MPDEVVVLFINMWDSRCGACGKPTLPEPETHEEVSGYGGGQKGCGAKFTHVSSDYTMPDLHLSIKSIRPDLVFLEPSEAHQYDVKVS